jgi:molybdopterin/thiamine biosynthesis adenylyltransferase
VAGELCRQAGKPLISGGTGVTAGQVIVFDPAKDHLTPAELLGLYDLVDRRQVENYERERASCLYQPEPAVVMTNQIIAGFMVESLRLLLSGQETPNRFYEAGAIP